MHERLSLAELEAFDTRATKGGTERRFRCPFCDPEQRKGRNLVTNTKTGAWKCHRCDKAGKLTEHWEERPKDQPFTSRRQRARMPQAPYQPPPPPEPPDPEKLARYEAEIRKVKPFIGSPAQAYLEGRGIPADVAKASRAKYGPTWFGRPAVVFPLYDQHGDQLAASGRHLKNEPEPKTHSAPEKRKSLCVFRTDPTALDAEPLIIAEAPITALSIAACGFPTIGTCGKVWPHWLRAVCTLRTVVNAYDSDEPGEKAAQKFTEEMASCANVHRLRPTPKKDGDTDWNDALQGWGREALTAWLRTALLPLKRDGLQRRLITLCHRIKTEPSSPELANRLQLAERIEADIRAIDEEIGAPATSPEETIEEERDRLQAELDRLAEYIRDNGDAEDLPETVTTMDRIEARIRAIDAEIGTAQTITDITAVFPGAHEVAV